MNYCKKCGQALKENTKFCSKCGTKVELVEESSYLTEEMLNSSKEAEEANSWIEDDLEDFAKEKKPNKSKKKLIIILFTIVLMVAIFAVSAFTFIKIKSNSKENNPSISIASADITKYPEVVITIKADNYPEDLKAGNFTIKEKDVFQKDLKLQKEEDNKYKISYKSSDEATSGERNVRVAYLENDKESAAEISYDAPEKSKNDNKTVNSNSTVNTYDKNEVDIKQGIDRFENAFIRMVNSKDINYIKDSLDLSGSVLSEYSNMLKSYSEQKITESLLKYDIENIKKVSDTKYEVTVYEKFNIYYGNKNETKQMEFRSTYTLNKINSVFKIYSLKTQVL